ncbi:hypothetical protein ACQE98_09890 [Ornithinimicrobium sp. W1679]|uniref:hypothetical protein n=1 Tax=unclassified Ornithinimicrobium TaxID=2615080 RepID=UPI003CFA4FAD
MPPLTGVRKVVYQAYRGLPDPVRSLPETLLRARAQAQVRRQPWFSSAGPHHRWLLGPLNTAGQAEAWARAARQHAGAQALSLSVERIAAGAGAFGYATDVHLSRQVQLRGLEAHRARVLGRGVPGATGVLAESGRPVLGNVFDGTVLDDLPDLQAAGIWTALLLHGSELRDLHAHAAAYPSSPFRGPWDERWERLQRGVERTRDLVARSGLPVLVSTPDLLDAAPGARLLPVVVDVDRLVAAAAEAGVRPLERDRPVVLHAPSNPLLKGTAVIEEVLGHLQDEGLVDYRRLSGVPHARMAALLADADVVVDQVVLGNPGVLAAEALAAGRVVVAHLAAAVRERLRDEDGTGAEVPVLEADAGTLAQVLRELLRDRAHAQDLAGRGPAWARRHHDGRRAAQVLSDVLGATSDDGPG